MEEKFKFKSKDYTNIDVLKDLTNFTPEGY